MWYACLECMENDCILHQHTSYRLTGNHSDLKLKKIKRRTA